MQSAVMYATYLLQQTWLQSSESLDGDHLAEVRGDFATIVAAIATHFQKFSGNSLHVVIKLVVCSD